MNGIHFRRESLSAGAATILTNLTSVEETEAARYRSVLDDLIALNDAVPTLSTFRDGTEHSLERAQVSGAGEVVGEPVAAG